MLVESSRLLGLIKLWFYESAHKVSCGHQGIIVAGPIFAATGSRWKAIGLSLASVRASFPAEI